MNRRIITLGDSTMQFNNFLKFPQTGWPQALVRFVKPEVPILNFAVNGKSTKNFISLNLFDKALKEIVAGDVVLIEFGHNDLKKEDPTRYTTPYGDYQFNLEKMVNACRAKGAEVILLTSITERYFENGVLRECHGEYPKAMQELAERIHVPCLDMYHLTRAVVQQTGDEESKRFYMNFKAGMYANYPNGLEDNTHLRYDGAYMVADCFYREMKRLNLFPELFLE